MKKYMVTIAGVLLTLCSIYGQNLQETNFIGDWKVKSIETLNSDEEMGDKKQFEMIKKMFIKSKFEFKADKRFNFRIEMKDMELTNKSWRFNSFKNLIIVTELNDNKSKLMEIKVSVENGKTYFILIETPIKLEVAKV